MATFDDLTPGFKPPITTGPITVEVDKEHRLIILANCSELIGKLSPTECAELEADLATTLTVWAFKKRFPIIL